MVEAADFTPSGVLKKLDPILTDPEPFRTRMASRVPLGRKEVQRYVELAVAVMDVAGDPDS